MTIMRVQSEPGCIPNKSSCSSSRAPLGDAEIGKYPERLCGLLYAVHLHRKIVGKELPEGSRVLKSRPFGNNKNAFVPIETADITKGS
jgi:hypothetical protein